MQRIGIAYLSRLFSHGHFAAASTTLTLGCLPSPYESSVHWSLGFVSHNFH